jgi:hypothetical protein
MGLRPSLKGAPLRRVVKTVVVLLECGHELRVGETGHGNRARCWDKRMNELAQPKGTRP